MSKIYDANEQTGVDMANARVATTFDVALVTDFLCHGRVEASKRKEVVDIMSSDPVFSKTERDFMTRSDRYKRVLAMTNRLDELIKTHGWSAHESSIAFDFLDEPIPMTLHTVAFEPVFMSQASPNLIAKYGQLIASRGILGCYLQTELGHGTNVAQLETTATFLPETQEFEIHSPTLTSRKWWIGGLGKTSTHGVVQAKLILPDGSNVGPHLFFVQLRSLDNHMVLPGIMIGDIGPKALGGCQSIDNGFAKFDRVRVPKEHMLSNFAQVTENGQYVQPPHPKLSYGGMVYIRSTMVTSLGWVAAKAATVSIRYATVRRQGERGSDGLECQIISYPAVYHRLLPILSHAYVFIRLGHNLTQAFRNMSTRLASGDTSLLSEMHVTTSGFKVLVSTTVVQDLEVARRSMGGHGYSAFAGLGRLYANSLPSTTYEGDNFVLDKQVVRGVLKAHKTLFSMTNPSATTLTPSSYYLRLLLDPAHRPPQLFDASWQDYNTPVLLLEWRAALMVQECARNQSNLDASANQRISKAVTEAFVASQVGGIIKNLRPLGERGAHVVGNLYRLYLLTTVEAALVDFLSFGLFRTVPTVDSQDITRSLRLAISKLCTELLPDAIGLSDAFAFSDWELDSALGVYNGRVYEALWNRAQVEPLNQTEVPAGYTEFIKPILQRGQKLAALGRANKL